MPGSNDLQSFLRALPVAVAAGAATGGGSLVLKLFESTYEVAGVGVVVLTLTLGLSQSGIKALGSSRKRERLSKSRAQQNAEILHRNEPELLRQYREIRWEAEKKAALGQLADPVAYQQAKDNALGSIIGFETGRITYICRRQVTLAVIAETGSEYIAKRKSFTELGAKIPYGLNCLRKGALHSVLQHYARHHHIAEFHVHGQTYYLVGLCDENVFDATVENEIERASNEYESTYKVFRDIAASLGIATTTPPLGQGA